MSPKTNLERVACYIRVSSEEQKLHGISLDAQVDKLTDYAKNHNLKIIDWYKDEGVSGRKLIRKRPELQRMLNDAQAKKFDRIIFIKLDRFFRSVAEYHECMKKIDPVIWTATEEKYDLSTANGRAFVNMKLTIAELEADQTGERIKIVNDYKVKTGQAINGYKALTLGYTTAKIDGVKKVVKNKDTAAMVEYYLNHFLTYHNKRLAFTDTRDKFNAPQGYNAFSNLLTDPKIYGYYRGNTNYCEPYITEAQFNQIQELLSHNTKHSPSGATFLYTGLIKCPECGRTLASRRSINKYGTEYIYYRCPNRIRERKCSWSLQLKETVIEKHLLEFFNQYVNSYIEATKIESTISQDVNITGKINALKGEQKRLNTMYQKERITEAEYDTEYNRITEQLKSLEAQLTPVSERDLSQFKELLSSDWVNIYHALNKPNKRAFWIKYIKQIIVDESGNISSILFF